MTIAERVARIARAVPLPATESQPTRSRRTLVLALAGVTALTEAASVAGLVPDLPIGELDLSIALLPALVLAVACGARLLGRSAIRRAAAGFWIASGLLLVVLGGLYVRDGRFVAFFPALVAAALGEELIYRLAIPAVIAAALRAGNVRPTAARIAGLAGAALWFVMLPGHREQITTPAGILPFVAFAGLSAFIVFRSGSVLPLAVGHAISNLLTVLMWREAVPADARSVGLASVLGLLVLAYGQFRPITVGDDGRLLDTRTGLAVVAIDLREGHEATVQLSDGRTLPIHADFAVPPHTPVLVLPEPAS